MTLTAPEALILQEGKGSQTFNKTVYSESNLRVIDPRGIVVSRKANTSYVFNHTIELLLGEVVTFRVDWVARCQAAGKHTLSLLALSEDPDVDPKFRKGQDTREVQIVTGSPIISELIVSPVGNLPGLDPQEAYVRPGKDIEVRCNITCPDGIERAILFYSMDSLTFWNQRAMSRNSGNEWVGTVPGQPEGTRIVLYVEAIGANGESSRTREYTCRAANLEALESTARIVALATVTTILLACTTMLALRRRRMTQML